MCCICGRFAVYLSRCGIDRFAQNFRTLRIKMVKTSWIYSIQILVKTEWTAISRLFCRFMICETGILFRRNVFKEYVFFLTYAVSILCVQEVVTYFIQLAYYIKCVTTSWTYCTVCPGRSDPFYILSYYIICVTTSWTHSILRFV